MNSDKEKLREALDLLATYLQNNLSGTPAPQWAVYNAAVDALAARETGDGAINEPEAAQPAEEPATGPMSDALWAVIRAADAAKEPCGTDPESPAAARNAKFATLASIAAQGLGIIRGPALAARPSPREQDHAGDALRSLKRFYDGNGDQHKVTWNSAVEACIAALNVQPVTIDGPAYFDPRHGWVECTTDEAADAQSRGWHVIESNERARATEPMAG